MQRTWYRCEKHKVLFTAISIAEARFATGRAVDHCGSGKTWWVENIDTPHGMERVEYWKERGYRVEGKE